MELPRFRPELLGTPRFSSWPEPEVPSAGTVAGTLERTTPLADAESATRPDDLSVADGDLAQAPPEDVARLPVTPAALSPVERRRRRAWRYRAAVAGAVLAGAVLAGALWGLASSPGGRMPGKAPAGAVYDPRRIAVLYFEDLSAGGELRHLATGFTERLIHELGQVPALQVVSSGGVRPYRDGTVPFDSMVASLEVGSVVEGTIQSARDSVWVTVRLVDANTGMRLESMEVAAGSGDLVRLERALAAEVAGALRRRLGHQLWLRAAAAETGSTLALDLMLRAEQTQRDALQMLRGDSLDAPSARRMLLGADTLLVRAQEADPRWARPALAHGWLHAARADLATGAERVRLLHAAVLQGSVVVARGGELRAEGLALRGHALFQLALEPDTVGQQARLEAAERDVRAAVALRPSLAGAWSTLSQILRARGMLAESDLAARRALEEDAYLDSAADIRARLFFGALWVRDFARAREECEGGRRRFPADRRFVECGLTLLRNDLSRPADPAAAWRRVAELDQADPPAAARAQGRPYSPVYRRMAAAAVSARAGDGERARAELARARREVGANPELALSLDYDEAWVRLMLGDAAGACRLVRQVARRRPALAPYMARDPLFCASSAP